MSKLYRNWPVHNLFGHPVSELAYWVVRPFGKSRAKQVNKWIHDSTLPVGHHDEAMIAILAAIASGVNRNLAKPDRKTADGHAAEQGE